jgi:Cytochrome oxidase complex assembly protein 1
MTTKKIVIIVLSIVLAVGLLIAVVAGAIVGIVFYSIGNSEAAVAAKKFLKDSDKLKQDIGEVKDFGSIVTGNISIQNAEGYANLNLKVIGEKRTVNANVVLVYHNGRPWAVTAASYKNEAGETVELLNVYESRVHIADLRSEISDRFRFANGRSSRYANPFCDPASSEFRLT